MTIEEKRKKNRIKANKWLKNNPEAREKNRLRNIEWRKNDPQKYLQAAAKYRNNNRPKLKEYKLKRRYGITSSQYLELVEIQNNRCAICGNEETALHNSTKTIQKLAVDHCHKTGKVRGLLCQDCNRGLGKFHDDPERLRKAIEYLG